MASDDDPCAAAHAGGVGRHGKQAGLLFAGLPRSGFSISHASRSGLRTALLPTLYLENLKSWGAMKGFWPPDSIG